MHDAARAKGAWDRAMVEETIAHLTSIAGTIDSDDGDNKRALAREYVAFEWLARAGRMAPGEAHRLASAFVHEVTGRGIGPHPSENEHLYLDDVTSTWARCDELIADGSDDARAALANLFESFERAYEWGYVAAGTPEQSAERFLTYGRAFLEAQKKRAAKGVAR